MTFDAGTDEALGGLAQRSGPARRPMSANSPLPILVLMHGEASSAGRIGQALQRRGHRLDIRKPRFGCALPQSLEHHAGVVVFGGPMSCNDPDEYLKREIGFAGVALREEKPFLGVCLGAQMLAKHLGAAVGKHPAGKVEIGYHPIAATPEGRRLGAWPEMVFQWHREGFELPSACAKLAGGAVFENQAFSCGDRVIGLQFHPEITYGLVNRWTTVAKDWKDSDGAQAREAQLDGHLLNAKAVAAWFERLLDGWLGASAGTRA